MGKMNIMWGYVILSYGLFWGLVLALCGTASMVFHASPLTMRILSDITAWSPTFAVIILYRKLKPNTKFIDFLKNCFYGQLKISLFLISGLIMLGGTFSTVGIVSLLEGKPFKNYFSLGGYSFMVSFFLSLFSGPTGEELGWRGYLRPEMNRKYGFLKGSIIQGIVWAFWHTLLWFIDSEFLDWRIIIYILSNVIVITSIALIMNIFLEIEENLLYSIWIHFCFNLPYSFLKVGISYYAVMCIIFPILACALYFYYQRIIIKKDEEKNNSNNENVIV
ncbi:CAAX amino terminal protease family protein [Anaeromyces robustus]|uniref:CAAX amino terminal protease family protein n=1 Tax=Anaeromyces robustus TaxID=1754192 RepID=A0A1Y1X3B6_9FUNG|nr:CAAX amino terminal protease family protein [Anaeromyces robustus]|eukprot:ORX80301.1 CAAX amino terminal protease family protein [Anaeromyces robustus]